MCACVRVHVRATCGHMHLRLQRVEHLRLQLEQLLSQIRRVGALGAARADDAPRERAHDSGALVEHDVLEALDPEAVPLRVDLDRRRVVRAVAVGARLHLGLHLLVLVGILVLVELVELRLELLLLGVAEAAAEREAAKPLVHLGREDAPRRADAIRGHLVLVDRLPAARRARRQRQAHLEMRRVHMERAEADVLGLAAVRQHLGRHNARHLAVERALAVGLGRLKIEFALVLRDGVEVMQLGVLHVVIVVSSSAACEPGVARPIIVFAAICRSTVAAISSRRRHTWLPTGWCRLGSGMMLSMITSTGSERPRRQRLHLTVLAGKQPAFKPRHVRLELCGLVSSRERRSSSNALVRLRIGLNSGASDDEQSPELVTPIGGRLEAPHIVIHLSSAVGWLLQAATPLAEAVYQVSTPPTRYASQFPTLRKYRLPLSRGEWCVYL